MTLAGMPPTIAYGGTSLVTMARLSTTARLPSVEPSSTTINSKSRYDCVRTLRRVRA